MNTDTLLERTPRPAPVTERLKDFCADLAQRAGEVVELSVTLSPAAWDCVRNDFQRPGKARPKEFLMSGPGYSVWFRREQGEDEATQGACLCDFACKPGTFDPRCEHPKHKAP